MIDRTAVLGTDVDLADGVSVGPFVVLGSDGPAGSVAVGRDATIRSHTVVYRDVVLGDRCHLGHGVLVRNGCRLGDDVSIGSRTVIEHSVEIGDGVRVHSACFLPELTVLEAGAWLGPGVIVTNARHPNRPDTKANLEGVRVGRGATVGAGVVLLPGVVVGEGALVGAGAVVVGDVPPGATVVGNPARVVP